MAEKRRKTIILCAALAFLLLTGTLGAADAGDKVLLFFFWGNGCPHCEREKAFLTRIEKKYPEVEIQSYEVWYHVENAALFAQLAASHGRKPEGVPAVFIGNFEPIIGYLSEEVTGKTIEEKVAYCVAHGCRSPADRLHGTARENEKAKAETAGPAEQEPPAAARTEEKTPSERLSGRIAAGGGTERGGKTSPRTPARVEPQGIARDGRGTIRLPFFGSIPFEKMSLPLLTAVIAGMDGFNPCAFFVLFLLLSILVYARSRKVMLLVGGTFVFFSGFIYFLFMSAWLNIFLLFGRLRAITIVAGVIALMIAAINIKDFFYFKKGVSLVIPDMARPKLFDRARGLLKKTSLPSMLAGTVILAIAANTYELLCTAGFPMVYTRALTLRELSASQYYLYLGLYNVIYVIPLSVIVVIFVVTLGARKFTEWQGQVLKLVSGMMMLFLGAVLLLEPSLLNHAAVSGGLLAVSLVSSGMIILVWKKLNKSQGNRL
ncbi:MAG: hypothetical protein M1497_05610 [Nitrospirae bacterium]|nr:hypothetical protein [Nitrospirota bacterium]